MIWQNGLGLYGNVNKNNTEVCGVCAESKITKLPFNKMSINKAKQPLQIIHTDICGPVTPCTHDNKRYILTFIDDFTHFSIICLLKSRDEMLNYFKSYVAFVSNLFQAKILNVRCDNAKEYASTAFKSFCIHPN